MGHQGLPLQDSRRGQGDAPRQRRRRRPRPPHVRPNPGRRHPRRREVQDLRGAQGGDRGPQGELGLPALQQHMAGPREAIQHMIIRKNYGCTHFIIGRDMAGSKSCLDGEDFYGAYDAQDLAKEMSEELGVKTVPSLNIVYTEEEGYVTADIASDKGLSIKKLSGTKFRQMLRAGEDIPEWFAFKSVVKVLRQNK